MTSKHLLGSAALVALSLLRSANADACSPPGNSGAVAGPARVNAVYVPRDGVIPYTVTPDTVVSEIEVIDSGGRRIRVESEASREDGARVLRPLDGDLRPGTLRVRFRFNGENVREDILNVEDARAADFAASVVGLSVTVTSMADREAPVVKCHHAPVPFTPGECGSANDAAHTSTEVDLPSRLRKAPLLGLTESGSFWTHEYYTWKRTYSVKRADGTIVEGSANSLPAIVEPGVEYCLSVEATPRHVAGVAKIARACVPNGDLRFDVTQQENDELLTNGSNQNACTALDFPAGVSIPTALEEKAEAGDGGGCSTSPRRAGAGAGGLAILLGLVAALRARRRQN